MMLFVKSAYATAVSFSFKRVPSVLSAPIIIKRIPLWPSLAVALATFWLLLAVALVQIDLDLTMVAIGSVALAILAVFSFAIIMLAHAYQNHL